MIKLGSSFASDNAPEDIDFFAPPLFAYPVRGNRGDITVKSKTYTASVGKVLKTLPGAGTTGIVAGQAAFLQPGGGHAWPVASGMAGAVRPPRVTARLKGKFKVC